MTFKRKTCVLYEWFVKIKNTLECVNKNVYQYEKPDSVPKIFYWILNGIAQSAVILITQHLSGVSGRS